MVQISGRPFLDRDREEVTQALFDLKKEGIQYFEELLEGDRYRRVNIPHIDPIDYIQRFVADKSKRFNFVVVPALHLSLAQAVSRDAVYNKPYIDWDTRTGNLISPISRNPYPLEKVLQEINNERPGFKETIVNELDQVYFHLIALGREMVTQDNGLFLSDRSTFMRVADTLPPDILPLGKMFLRSRLGIPVTGIFGKMDARFLWPELLAFALDRGHSPENLLDMKDPAMTTTVDPLGFLPEDIREAVMAVLNKYTMMSHIHHEVLLGAENQRVRRQRLVI